MSILKNTKEALSSLFFLVVLLVGCAHLEKSGEGDTTYVIQSTDQLDRDFAAFIKQYNKTDVPLDDFLTENFLLETVRPTTQHRELDHRSEV